MMKVYAIPWSKSARPKEAVRSEQIGAGRGSLAIILVNSGRLPIHVLSFTGNPNNNRCRSQGCEECIQDRCKERGA